MSFTRRDGVTFEIGDHVTFWDVHNKEVASGVCESVAPILYVRGRSASSTIRPYYWAVVAADAKHSSAVDQLGKLAR